MSLIEKMDVDIKSAMLSKDKEKLEGLRAIKSALLVMKTQGSDVVITEDMELKMLQKLVKQRKESAEIYLSQDRQDLADVELSQASVIEVYLPKQLSLDELRLEVEQIIKETGATTIRDMGKVTGLVSKKFVGRADGKAIADIVKNILK